MNRRKKITAHEQAKAIGWQMLDEQQQQAAKTGTIAVDSVDGPGNVDSIQAVADSDPLRATIGGLAVLAVKATDLEMALAAQITNDLTDRRLRVFPASAGGDIVGAVAGATGMVKSAELTFDGGENNGAPMTNTVANGTGLATAINAALAPAKPSYTLATIINKLEDILLLDATKDGVVIVDQAAEKVYLYTGTPANVAAAALAAFANGTDPAASFEQDASPASVTEGQFGE